MCVCETTIATIFENQLHETKAGNKTEQLFLKLLVFLYTYSKKMAVNQWFLMDT